MTGFRAQAKPVHGLSRCVNLQQCGIPVASVKVIYDDDVHNDAIIRKACWIDLNILNIQRKNGLISVDLLSRSLLNHSSPSSKLSLLQ